MSFMIYLAAGFASGLLGGMGMGGGTIMIPALTIFCGVEQHTAQLTNLLSFLPMAAASLSVHKKQGLIRTEGLLVIVASAVLSSAACSLAALFLPGVFLRKLFGAFLVGLAVHGAAGCIQTLKK